MDVTPEVRRGGQRALNAELLVAVSAGHTWQAAVPPPQPSGPFADPPDTSDTSCLRVQLKCHPLQKVLLSLPWIPKGALGTQGSKRHS